MNSDYVTRSSLLLIIAALISATGAPVRAAGEGGTNSANILLIGSGGRGPALGEAITSSASNTDALRYNPAGLAGSSAHSLDLSGNRYVQNIAFGNVSYSSRWDARSGWGMGVRYIDYGSTQRTTVADPTGSSLEKFSGNDYIISAGYGYQLTNRLSIGAAGRYISSTIDQRTATAVAADIGTQWRITERLLSGFAIQNIGTTLQYQGVEEDLPVLIRGGLNYELLPKVLFASLEGEKVRNQRTTFHAGMEYRFRDTLSIRAGYDGRSKAGSGITAGIGYNFDPYTINYAYSPMGEFGSSHRIAINLEFGNKGAWSK